MWTFRASEEQVPLLSNGKYGFSLYKYKELQHTKVTHSQATKILCKN